MEPEYKTPTELLPITIDWSYRISSALTISSVTAASTDIRSGLSSSTTVLTSTTGSIAGFNTTFSFKAGQTDGESHTITYTATASDGTVYQAYQNLYVKAPHA